MSMPTSLIHSALCQSCGMCCDGTLFGRARMEATDLELARRLGLDVAEAAQKLFFHLPCSHHKGSCCVYAAPRPTVCVKFFCEPLIHHRNGALGTTEVQALIAETLRIRGHFLRASTAFPEFAGKGIQAIRTVLMHGQRNTASIPEEDRRFRAHYGPLLTIGFRLFPLLDRFYRPGKSPGEDPESSGTSALPQAQTVGDAAAND